MPRILRIHINLFDGIVEGDHHGAWGILCFLKQKPVVFFLFFSLQFFSHFF